MQGGSAGVRAVHMGRAGVGLLGTAATNLRVMSGYRHLMCGRRFQVGWKPLRARHPKRNSLTHYRLKSSQVKSNVDTPTNGVARSSAGRWNLLVLLVGRGRHVQVVKELIELTQVLSRLVVRQFEVQTAERIRRGLQLYFAYSRLWGEEAARALLNNLRCMLVSRGRQLLLSAVCFSQYDWEANKISEDYLNSAVRDLETVEALCKATIKCGNCGKRQVIDQQMGNIEYCMCDGQLGYTDTSRVYDSWAPFIERNHHIVWRKEHEVHQHLYAYKVYGKYDDVCLSAFMEVQLNSDFRTEWDDTALQLRILDSHKESNSDLIYWLVKYPTLFANRDYIYKRRFLWNEEKQEAIIMNEAISPDHIPEEKGIHRVNEYWSTMVIRAKTNANEPGLEYTLTYFDNPGTSLPQWLTNFIAVTGFPSFLQKVHEAAVSLQAIHEKGKDVYVSLPKELRYPTRPTLETPTLERPTDFDIVVGKDIIPAAIKETSEVPVISELTEVLLPVLDKSKDLASDVLKESVSGDHEEDLSLEARRVELSTELAKVNEELDDVVSLANVDVTRDENQKSKVEPDVSNPDISEDVEQKLGVGQVFEEAEASSEERVFTPEGIESSEDKIKSLEEFKSGIEYQELPLESKETISETALSPELSEIGSEINREISTEASSEIKSCDVVENVTISDMDKSLQVQRGSKKVEVGILEGMEVVAPDLDEQTALSRKVKKLTTNAIEELESRTVLIDKFEKLKNRVKLFHKHAHQKKETSIRKMHELEERSHYEHFDDQTRKHLERLFEAMQEVLRSDKEMRTGKGLMGESSPENYNGEAYAKGRSDSKDPYQSTSFILQMKTSDSERKGNEASSNKEYSESSSSQKKVDEKENTSSKKRSKPSDDPPPPPPPQLPAMVGMAHTSAESESSGETTSNEVETYNGIDDVGIGAKSNISYSVWKSWMYIPYLTNWSKAEGKGHSVESLKLNDDQNSNSIVGKVRYVDEKPSEETSVSRYPHKSDIDENYNWYWYPVDGAYRLYAWAFKSSKENA